MSAQRLLSRSPVWQVCSVQARAASRLARVAAKDSRPVKYTTSKPPSTEQLRPNAERKPESHLPAGIAPLPLPLVPVQTIPTPANYFVQRTPTRNLPIYLERKSGGNLKQTRVRKISGKATDLLEELGQILTPRPEWLKINPITGHIEMKGWYKDQISKFLQAKGF